MIRLEAYDLSWINGSSDDPNDQCAHGRIEFRTNGYTFVKPEDGVWTLSATALYLLRSLTEDHTKDNSVAECNFLFPCCGFNTWLEGRRFGVVCMGCPNGIDMEIVHQQDSIILRSELGQEIIPATEWKSAVLTFVASIQDFYDRCSPKSEPFDDLDQKGWTAFWQEWNERCSLARAEIGSREPEGRP